MLYGAECWPIKKPQAQRLMVVNMRMIRWMCQYTRLDRVRNVLIRERAGVAPLEEKMRETRVKRYGHGKRSVDAPVRRCEAIDVTHCKRRREQSKMSWNEVIKGDMKFLGLTEDMAQDKNLWRFKIKSLDHS